MKYYLQIRNSVIDNASIIENGFTAINIDADVSILCTSDFEIMKSLCSVLGVTDFTKLNDLK